MNIEVEENGMRLGQLIKFIGSGYLCGFGVLFLIPFIAMLVASPFMPANEEGPSPFVIVFMIPVILALQAVMLSLVVAFGHWVFRKFSTISIEIK